MISVLVFFFNDTATTEIYTLSLHDALPIYVRAGQVQRATIGRRVGRAGDGDRHPCGRLPGGRRARRRQREVSDRKSTRLNSSHLVISYAVFCLKKKKNRNF